MKWIFVLCALTLTLAACSKPADENAPAGSATVAVASGSDMTGFWVEAGQQGELLNIRNSDIELSGSKIESGIFGPRRVNVHEVYKYRVEGATLVVIKGYRGVDLYQITPRSYDEFVLTNGKSASAVYRRISAEEYYRTKGFHQTGMRPGRRY